MQKTNGLLLRPEQPADYHAIVELTREAFWNHHVPGCDEHYLVQIMRDTSAFITALDYVAELDGRLVGNIMYTRARIAGNDGRWHPVISFGPISVHPDAQRQGVGRALIEHTAQLAVGLGYHAIVIYGDPDYYSRVGFVAAEKHGIATHDDCYADALLARELCPGALTGCAGCFFEDPSFTIDPAAVEEFDKSFAPREKQSGLPSQRRFEELLVRRRPRK